MKTFRIDYRRKWTYFLQHSYSQGWVGVEVGVGVGVRCVERYDLVKTAFQFRLRLLRLRSSEIWVVGDASRSRRTKPITKRGNMQCNWFILPLLLPTTTTWFSLDRKRWSHKRSRKKRKRSDSSDSDSFALMTPLTTPTLSLVKTNHRPKSIGSSRSTRPSGCTFTCKPSRIRESLFFSSLLCAEELYQFSDTRASLSWLVLQQLFPLRLLTITSFQSTQLILDFLCLIYHKTH